MRTTTDEPSSEPGLPFTHRPPGSPRATILRIVLALVVLGTLGCLVVPSIMQSRAQNLRWKADAPKIAQALNDTYVEPVRVTRVAESHNRNSILVETITVDGVVRKDCTVPRSFTYAAPSLTCTRPLVLTRESVQP